MRDTSKRHQITARCVSFIAKDTGWKKLKRVSCDLLNYLNSIWLMFNSNPLVTAAKSGGYKLGNDVGGKFPLLGVLYLRFFIVEIEKDRKNFTFNIF